MKLQPTWKICDEEQTPSEEVRRGLLRNLLLEEDAYWGVRRSDQAMEGQLDYLMGLRSDPYPTSPEDFTGL